MTVLDEPSLALRGLDGLVVLDEIQRRPDLLPLLRVLADRPRPAARFLFMALFRTAAAGMGMIGTASRPQVLWPLFGFLQSASAWINTVAMAGIGLTTHLGEMRKPGLRPFLCGLVTTLIVASVSLLLIFGLHLKGVAISSG